MIIKTCNKCNTPLIPLSTQEGNILTHIQNTCENAMYAKTVLVSIQITDKELFTKSQDLFGKADYTIEDVFNHVLKQEEESKISWWKKLYSKLS